MSEIITIYTALAAKAVTVNGVTPIVFDLHELPNSVESQYLPCRLLTPMTPRGEAREHSFIALGTLSKITWHITDLMLWREAQQGIGLQDIADILVAYAGAYAEMLRTFRAPSAQSHIINSRFVYGIYEWPEGSGRYFDGCACEIDIEEALSL